MPFYYFDLLVDGQPNNQGSMILEDLAVASDRADALASELRVLKPELRSRNCFVRVVDENHRREPPRVERRDQLERGDVAAADQIADEREADHGGTCRGGRPRTSHQINAQIHRSARSIAGSFSSRFTALRSRS